MDIVNDRKFGIENEMTGKSMNEVAHIVNDYINEHFKLNSTIRNSSPHKIYDGKNVKCKTSFERRKWIITHDDSIEPIIECDSKTLSSLTDDEKLEYKIELKSPPLTSKDIVIYKNILDILKDYELKVNNSCGVHIHVDVPEISSGNIPNTIIILFEMLKQFYIYQDFIYEGFEVFENREKVYCKKLGKNILNKLEIFLEQNFDISKNWILQFEFFSMLRTYAETGKLGINIFPFNTYGTIEFPLFNGTLDSGLVEAYIKFCVSFVEYTIKLSKNLTKIVHKNERFKQCTSLKEYYTFLRDNLRLDEKTIFIATKGFRDKDKKNYIYNQQKEFISLS